MIQNSRSYFPARTAPALRMKIVAIIAAIAVIVFLAGCDVCPPGAPPPGNGVSILLLAETSQLATVHSGTVVTDLLSPPPPPPLPPPPGSDNPDNPGILINTTFTRQLFRESVQLPPPVCAHEALDNAEILDQFDQIQNKGDAPIYAVIVPEAPADTRFNNISTYRQVFAEVREDFPNYGQLRTAYTHLSGGYQELLISDSTGLIDPATAPRWVNAKNFVDRFTEEICNGNATTCKYMTVIEPGTTGHIVSTSFARSPSLDGR